jgi:glycosyltransferase involved in cell wall biosynthesis
MSRQEPLAILYLGPVTPNEARYKNAAFSTAGNLFQLNLLRTLASDPSVELEVVGYAPVPSFPRVKKLFFGATRATLPWGLQIRFLPHVNLGFLKIVSMGVAEFFWARSWARRNRGRERILLCYNLNAPPGWPLYWAAKTTDVKIVTLLQDINTPGEIVADTFLRRLEFRSQTALLPKLSGLMVASPHMQEDFAPGSHYLVLAGGVPESYLDSFPEPEKPSSGLFEIVSAGALTSLNGIDLLLKAMSLVKNPSIRLTIAGKGPLEEAVRAAAAHDDRIRFAGLIPHEAVRDLYLGASMIVNLRDTSALGQRYVFPSKLIEAMSTGRPVLSTRVNGSGEFAEHLFMLDDETPEGLAVAIDCLATQPWETLAARGRAAQSYVRSCRTWESHGGRMMTYLRETVLCRENTANPAG